MFKKILAFALALLMTAAVFTGCAKKKSSLDDETSDATAATTVDTTDEKSESEAKSDDLEFDTDTSVVVDDTSIYDELTIEQLLKPENFQGSDIPEERDYGGYEFKVLADSLISHTEFLSESDGTLIKDALINRQEWIEEYISIDFVLTELYGGYADMEGFAAEIESASGAGTPYDLALAYNLIPPLVAAKGLSKDLAESENLNLLNTEKEYWGKEIKKEIMIGGRIFWMSDNSSYHNIQTMLCIFVNTEFFSRAHPGKDKNDLYDMVYNGSWTMDNMFSLIQNTYDNSNVGTEATNNVDDGDVFGLQATERGAWLDCWLYAAGLRYTALNTRGTYDWTLDDQTVVDFIDWFQEKLNDDDVDKSDSTQYSMFSEGRAMFAYSDFAMVETNLELEYTVLPLPLYKSSIKNSYSTPIHDGCSSWLIPRATRADAFERSATVLELLAAEGNRRLAPVYFEIYLKRQNAGHDENMQKMFNIIRNAVVFDLGYLYGTSLRVENLSNGSYEELFIAVRRVWSGNGSGAYANISTVWSQVKNTATTKLNNLMFDILDY